MKSQVNANKRGKQPAEVPFDAVLFAATVASRKPTTKDLEDTKAHENDPIEPREYDDPKEMLEAS